jgi:hypothetical protein
VIAISILGIGPMGLLIMVFLCATAGGLAGRDITDAGQVLRHFTIKEIRKIKIYAICAIIFIFHGLAYLMFHLI